jgi:DNA polymerase
LSAEERKIFERSWRKNDIGLPIDIELASAIAARRTEIEHEAATQLREITDNQVTAVTQRQRIIQWADSGNRAAGLNGTKKHEVAEYLENPELHPDVRTVLEILQDSGGSAPTKAQALLNRHVNGWYKDATRYFGARSGRGTSEGANMFNIAKPSGKYKTDEVITGLKAGFRYDNTALTDALRGCVVAPAGYAIIDNDLSNAELRIALWQSGDRERLDILQQPGGDLYMHNAITMWGLPATATRDTHPKERFDGKTTTLGGNYQLGWKTYKAHMRRIGMTISDTKAQDDIKNYRKANPLLTNLWTVLKNAWYNCFYDPPGHYYYAGKIALIKDGTTIWMTLPSGRSIPHYSVFVGQDGNMGFFRAKFGAMLPQKVFGGSLLEISCQAMTRDIITACEDDIEKEMPDTYLLLDVYDSIIAIAPVEVAKQREEQMRSIMRRQRNWTDGLPLDAEGYSAPRMRK